MNADTNQLKAVWDQYSISVVLRRDGKGEKLRVRLPDSPTNEAWLRNGRSLKPIWNTIEECWELPKAWFNDLVARAVQKYGKLYIIQPFREQDICARACQEATGHECQCSCMGQHHGSGNDGSWFEISEAFACRWRDRTLACRLMVRK